MPKYSTVIPLYNKVAHISRAIDSVLTQKLSDLELIVVNDGSTDGSQKIVEGYQDSRVRLINQLNTGVSAARNTGIQNSTAPYVALLDADDAWDPEFLCIIDEMTLKFPNAGAYATHIREIHSDQPQSTKLRCSAGAKDSYMIENFFALLNSDLFPVSSSSTCVKKSVLIEVGLFDETLAIGEDIDAWIRVFLRSGIALSNCHAATYYMNSEHRSIHRRDYTNRKVGFLRHLRKLYLNSGLDRCLIEPLDDWTSRKIFQAIIQAILNGDKPYAAIVLRNHWRDLSQKQRAIALVRLLAPSALVDFWKSIVVSKY